MANRKNRKQIEIAQISVGELSQMFDKGRMATVQFIKKGDGSLRTLNGKTKAFGALKGGEPSYDATSRGQLRVADVNVYKDRQGNPVPRRTEYRTVTAQNVVSVTSNGVKYIVKDGAKPLRTFIRSYSYTKGKFFLNLVDRSYVYKKVPSQTYKDFCLAENKGEFFNQNIKGKFDFDRV